MNFTMIQDEIILVAVRSRGPGGQNVNKVSSAAQLFWNFADSQGLSAPEKSLVRNKMSNMINKEDQVFLRADEFRDLERNKSRAVEKLKSHLTAALHRPKPRRPTRPTRASKLRKLDTKAHRGNIKKGRSRVDWE